MTSVKKQDLELIQEFADRISARFTPALPQARDSKGVLGELRFFSATSEPVTKKIYLVSPRSRMLDTFAHFPADFKETLVCFVQGQAPQSLSESGLNFIDRAGNAFLKFPGMYIDIRGRQIPDETRENGISKRGSIFPKAYLRVIFVLLAYPQLLGAKVAEIADSAGVSPATVSGAFQMLVSEGYLVVEGRYRRLRYGRKLVKVWAEHYRTGLLPSLQERRVQGPSPQEWRKILKDYPHDYGLSGENALAALGFGIAPESSTVYGSYPWKHVMVDYRLRQDSEGSTILREKFWKEPSSEKGGATVPELLIYADCLATQDSRQIEIVEKLEKRLGKF